MVTPKSKPFLYLKLWNHRCSRRCLGESCTNIVTVKCLSGGNGVSYRGRIISRLFVPFATLDLYLRDASICRWVLACPWLGDGLPRPVIFRSSLTRTTSLFDLCLVDQYLPAGASILNNYCRPQDDQMSDPPTRVAAICKGSMM